MSTTSLYAIISLSSIGTLAAVILYFIAKKFYVYEDPKVTEVEDVLPSANCGACGYPGCHNFAKACVAAADLSEYFCPVGGNECMADVAEILGKEVVTQDPMIAVVRCSGSPEFRKKTTIYDGASTCVIEAGLYSGDTDCVFGCMGLAG